MNNLFFKKIINKAQQSALFIIAIFSFFNVHADDIPLRYGDALCLSQQINNVPFHLGVQNNNGIAVPGAWKIIDSNTSTKLYIQPGTATNRWGSNSNAIVQDGDFVRLEVASMANTVTPGWLGYDFSKASGEQPAVFFPQTTNFSSSVPRGIVLQICKINGASSASTSTTGTNTSSTTSSVINCGDQVLFWGYTNSGGGSALSPLALEITANASSTTSANLMFSSSGTTNNPANYPNSDCWYISSVTSNASVADQLTNTLPQATAQNVNSWAAQKRPSLLGVTAAQGIPLNYGDAFMFQHATYNFYLRATNPTVWAANTNSWMLYGVTTQPTDNSGMFFVEELQAANRFASAGKLGTQVKSGDYIRLESVFGQNNRPGANGSPEGFSLFFNTNDGYNQTISTPCPPYFVTIMHGGGYAWTTASSTSCQWPACGYAIYKIGANVGDLIWQGDSIYIVSWTNASGKTCPVWLGSANLPSKDGFETFIYHDTTAAATPPNFPKNFLWTVTNIQGAAYKNPQLMKNVGFGSGSCEIAVFPKSANLFQH